MRKQLKVFRMNDCEWWCHYSAEQARKDYKRSTGEDAEDVSEVSQEFMNTMKFADEDTPDEVRTFNEELATHTKPGFFATTEY